MIGERCAVEIRSVAEAGHETGVHAWDHVGWHDRLDAMTDEKIREQIALAHAAYERIFGRSAQASAAAGWTVNARSLAFEAERGLRFTSNTRLGRPFFPLIDGNPSRTLEIPTTLPTLDELIGVDGLTAHDVADRVLELSRNPPPSGHVFTLHAELEGMKLAGALERLLEGWQALGYALVPLRALAESLDVTALPRCRVVDGEIPGRSGRLALQGEPVAAS